MGRGSNMSNVSIGGHPSFHRAPEAASRRLDAVVSLEIRLPQPSAAYMQSVLTRLRSQSSIYKLQATLCALSISKRQEVERSWEYSVMCNPFPLTRVTTHRPSLLKMSTPVTPAKYVSSSREWLHSEMGGRRKRQRASPMLPISTPQRRWRDDTSKRHRNLPLHAPWLKLEQ